MGWLGYPVNGRLVASTLAIGVALLSVCVMILSSREDEAPPPAEIEVKVPVRLPQIQKSVPPIVRRAADFPHNLKTFADWGSVSSDEMSSYRVSLISRVGRWEAEEIAAWYKKAAPGITDGDALREFREAVLGVWCSKDVDGCLLELRQDAGAKQDALAGWAQEDWVPALRFLQRDGDRSVEAQLGGDSSRFVKNLLWQVAEANGVGEAAEVASYLKTPTNRAAAESVIAGLKAEDE